VNYGKTKGKMQKLTALQNTCC